MQRVIDLISKVSLPVLVFIFWELLARFIIKNLILIPPPSIVFLSLYEMTLSGEIFLHSSPQPTESSFGLYNSSSGRDTYRFYDGLA